MRPATCWTAGGGIAVAFEQNWNVFAEYRYTSYGSTAITLPFSDLSTTFRTKVSEIDLGANYKFNWNAPVVVKVPTPTNPQRPAPSPVYKAPPGGQVYDWSGFYLGGEAVTSGVELTQSPRFEFA